MDSQRQPPPHHPPAVNEQLSNQRQLPPPHQPPPHQQQAVNKQLSNMKRPPAPLRPPATSNQLSNMDSPAPPKPTSTKVPFTPHPMFKQCYLVPLLPNDTPLIEQIYIAQGKLKPLHEIIKKAESQLEEILKPRPFVTPIVKRRIRSISGTDKITASSSSLAPPQQHPASVPFVEPTTPERSEIANSSTSGVPAVPTSSNAPLDIQITNISSIPMPLDCNDPSTSTPSIFDPVLPNPKRHMAKKHTGPRKNKKSLSSIDKLKLKYGIKDCQITLYDFEKHYPGGTWKYGEWDPVARSTIKKKAGKQKVSNTNKDKKKSTEISKKFPDNGKSKMEVTVPKNKRSHSDKSGPAPKKLKKNPSGVDGALPIRINLSRISGNEGVVTGGNSSKGEPQLLDTVKPKTDPPASAAQIKKYVERPPNPSVDVEPTLPVEKKVLRAINGAVGNKKSAGALNGTADNKKTVGALSDTVENKKQAGALSDTVVNKKHVRALSDTVVNKKHVGALNSAKGPTPTENVRCHPSVEKNKAGQQGTLTDLPPSRMNNLATTPKDLKKPRESFIRSPPKIHRSYLQAQVLKNNNNDDSYSDGYKIKKVVRLPDDKTPSANLDLSAVNLQRLNPQRVKPDHVPRPVRWNKFTCQDCSVELFSLSDWMHHTCSGLKKTVLKK